MFDSPWPLCLMGEPGYAILLHLNDAQRARLAGEGEGRWARAEALLDPGERGELRRIRQLFPENTVSVCYEPPDRPAP